MSEILSDKVRILVIEDHFVTLDGMVGGLSREPDFEIVGSCVTAEAGIALADKERPEVIITDLHVPGNFNPTALIKELMRFPDRKLVLFSVETRLAYVQAVLSLGVSAYLSKSEPFSVVADTVRQVMKGRTGIVSQHLTREFCNITPSETEILHMLGKGMKYAEIGDARSTSVATARKQCEILQMKLGLQNREQLIAWSVQNGYGNFDLG